jgi:hypothetical protein
MLRTFGKPFYVRPIALTPLQPSQGEILWDSVETDLHMELPNWRKKHHTRSALLSRGHSYRAVMGEEG